MNELEEDIWTLVHGWCDQQYHEIPDDSRRYLMDQIKSLVKANMHGQAEEERGLSIGYKQRRWFVGYEQLKDFEKAALLLKDANEVAPFIDDGEVIGYPFNLEQTIAILTKQIIPEELGIYHLFDDDSNLLYIGMSNNIRKRLLMHLNNNEMQFTRVLWFCASWCKENATRDEILAAERRLIKKHKPPLNKHMNKTTSNKQSSQGTINN